MIEAIIAIATLILAGIGLFFKGRSTGKQVEREEQSEKTRAVEAETSVVREEVSSAVKQQEKESNDKSRDDLIESLLADSVRERTKS